MIGRTVGQITELARPAALRLVITPHCLTARMTDGYIAILGEQVAELIADNKRLRKEVEKLTPKGLRDESKRRNSKGSYSRASSH